MPKKDLKKWGKNKMEWIYTTAIKPPYDKPVLCGYYTNRRFCITVGVREMICSQDAWHYDSEEEARREPPHVWAELPNEPPKDAFNIDMNSPWITTSRYLKEDVESKMWCYMSDQEVIDAAGEIIEKRRDLQEAERNASQPIPECTLGVGSSILVMDEPKWQDAVSSEDFIKLKADVIELKQMLTTMDRASDRAVANIVKGMKETDEEVTRIGKELTRLHCHYDNASRNFNAYYEEAAKNTSALLARLTFLENTTSTDNVFTRKKLSELEERLNNISPQAVYKQPNY